MMLNPKRVFEQMCFKCSLEGWHTTTTPDLFWQIVPQTRSQNTKCTVTICHTFRGWHNKQIIIWRPQIVFTVGAWDQHFCQVRRLRRLARRLICCDVIYIYKTIYQISFSGICVNCLSTNMFISSYFIKSRSKRWTYTWYMYYVTVLLVLCHMHKILNIVSQGTPGSKAILLYYCPECISCTTHLNCFGWATWAIWVATKKYSFNFLCRCVDCFSQTEAIMPALL